MSKVNEIQTGNPVILKNAKGMSRYKMKKGMKGMSNQVITVDGKDLIMFMPEGTDNMYYMDKKRFVLDVEAMKGEKDETQVL